MMAFRLINGAEFLHIPKTGGSWVKRVMQENNLIDRDIGGHEHADYDRVLNKTRCGNGRDLINEASRLLLNKMRRKMGLPQGDRKEERPIRFCFVRHPLSWYESWWKYMSGKGWNNWGLENSSLSWHPNSILNGLGSDDFNTFVENVINKRPGYVSELYFAFTKSGIDFIGKTENLSNDLASILDMISIPYNKNSLKTTDRVNVSQGSGDIEWDPSLRKAVIMLELPSLIHFGYLNDDDRHKIGFTKLIEPNKAVQATELRSTPDS